ncbi:hypothetical protein EJ07DRAFT_158659 [Lizonia empirigonia]|nr:hypothetical protein EJ07DRAFT_158659 [Lizonia empirigonia]
MDQSSHRDGRLTEGQIGIKDEYEQKLLNSISSHSTIAQFIKSGQAAFGSVDPALLQKHKEVPGEVHKWMLGHVRERLASASELYYEDIVMLRPLLQLEYSTAGSGNPDSTGFYCLLPELLRLMKSNLTCAVTFTNYVLDASDNEVSKAMKEELLRAVAQVLGAVSIDMRGQDTISRHGGLSEPHPQAKLSPAAFGTFIKYFYSIGLYKPIEAMLAHFRTEMVHAHSVDLHTIYVPILQELISLMLIFGIPMTNATYSAFFEVVLQEYFARFVGPKADQTTAMEQTSWNQRAIAARSMLESFDHSHFRDILGQRYDSSVLPAHNRIDSVITKTSVTTDDNKIDPDLTA